ncbi:translation initiation factor IF-2 [Hyaena hyaena]|uniref:translation initiation factor IF-2 n=1 Tax=Hyaena hyaena TaxID=95912 RepID=UPI0019243412|nr:translation initiation factor IF-2 [Hyaena hyaena]
MVRRSSGSRVWGLRPGAASSGARASPPPALLCLAASAATDCGATPAPGHRGRTGAGSPRPRRPAGPRAALRGARGTPCHRGAPPPPAAQAPGPHRPVAGAGGLRRSLAPPPRAALPPPPRAARGCTGGWALRSVCGRRTFGGGGSEAAAPPAAPARRPRRGGVSPITRLTSRSAKKARSEWTQSLRPGKGAGLSGGGEAWGSRREPLEESQGLASQG